MHILITLDNCDQEQSIRLADSSSSSSGRVEICHHGTWGTVCNISFSVHDGNVICHHLGFPLGMTFDTGCIVYDFFLSTRFTYI